MPESKNNVVKHLELIKSNSIQSGIIVAVSLSFSWLMLGRLIDLLFELLWLVWVALAVSAVCYLPRIKIYQQQRKRSPLNQVLSKAKSNLSFRVRERESYSEFLGSNKIDTEKTTDKEHDESTEENCTNNLTAPDNTVISENIFIEQKDFQSINK